jgi:hypothetical protein
MLLILTKEKNSNKLNKRKFGDQKCHKQNGNLLQVV